MVIPEAGPVTRRPTVMANPETDLDMDIDSNAETNTDIVPLKKMDKGKGKAKAADLIEELSPRVC